MSSAPTPPSGTLIRTLCWLVALLPATALGQELIPNGGFEKYQNCPRQDNLLSEAAPWYNPNRATPDFYHRCFPTDQIELPPRSGQGLARLFLDQGWAEYLATPLVKPLDPGECYYFELYISTRALTQYLPGTMGVYFSQQPVLSTAKELLPVRPQILDSPVKTVSKAFQWERIAGFYKAAGGERFVTIGSFNQLPQFLGFYYVFLDDVSLVPLKLDLGRDTTLCGRKSTKLLNAQTPGATEYRWQDGSTSPTYRVTKPGKYSVTVTTPCKILRDSITVDYALDFTLGADTTLCTGQSLTLRVPADAPVYRWQDGSAQPAYAVSQSGAYSLQVSQAGCTVADTIGVQFIDRPTLELGPGKALCGAEVYPLKPTYAGGKFAWQDGFGSEERTIDSSGVFRATVRNACAVVSDSVEVNYGDCGCVVYAPELFTPNADGVNDLFRPFACGDIRLRSLSVYSRWGELIFRSDALPFEWDGRYKGAVCPAGVYAWRVDYLLYQRGKARARQAQGLLLLAP